MTMDQQFDQFLVHHGFTEMPFSVMVKLRKAFDAGHMLGYEQGFKTAAELTEQQDMAGYHRRAEQEPAQ